MNKNNTPKISVIMSVYNEEKYIAEALNSILKQSEPDFEVIVIDDCSQDKTADIIDQMSEEDSRIKLVRNTSNQGLTKNLNQALELTRGDFIARMDGDDISEPDRFKVQLEYLRKHPNVYLVSCNHVTFGEQKLVSDIGGTSEEIRCRMLLRPQLAHPGFMMRAELVRVHGFRYDTHYVSAQDYDFAVRVASFFGVAVTTERLLRYRAHEGQVSQNPSKKQVAYADEVRSRQLSELGISLNEEEHEAFSKWAFEMNASSDEYTRCRKLLKKILRNNNNTYVSGVLRYTLWQQFYVWIFRTGSMSEALKQVHCNPYVLIIMISTGIGMYQSKRRRAHILNMLMQEEI